MSSKERDNVAYWRDRALKAEEIARPWIDAGIDLRQKLEAAEKQVRELEAQLDSTPQDPCAGLEHNYQPAATLTQSGYRCARCGRVR